MGSYKKEKNEKLLDVYIIFKLSKLVNRHSIRQNSIKDGTLLMQYVVFGATGYIGAYIFQRMVEEGFDVIGTSRRESCIGDNLILYDILNDNLDNIMSEISYTDRIAIVCIAESNIDRCSVNYIDAYKVNVIRTKELIHELSMEGFRIIFFSSDQVFDGKFGNYTEESERHPINKYGVMKSEMESYLLSNEPNVCILRIPKVVSALRKKQNVLSEWTDRIAEGNIRCIKGNRLSFVSIDDIYNACQLVAEKKLRGLYNIAGDRVYSRAELAHLFFDKLGQNNIEIKECDVKDFPFKDKRPLTLSMSNAKFKTETGYTFESMDSVIDRYIDNIKES